MRKRIAGAALGTALLAGPAVAAGVSWGASAAPAAVYMHAAKPDVYMHASGQLKPLVYVHS